MYPVNLKFHKDHLLQSSIFENDKVRNLVSNDKLVPLRKGPKLSLIELMFQYENSIYLGIFYQSCYLMLNNV